MNFFIHFLQRTHQAIKKFSPLEQLVALAAFVVVVGFVYMLVFQATHQQTTIWPERGGTLTIGGMGTPRLIHPLYAETASERDLVEMVYVGLLHEEEDGQLVPALAQSYQRSADGTEYTFLLREDAFFHDGMPVTADDVIFTIQQAQNPAVNTYLAIVWNTQDVVARKIDERTVRITNKAGNVDFAEHLTLGILPAHIWQELSPDEQLLSAAMTEAVGAGPFSIERIKTNREGIPTSFTLRRFDNYALGSPYMRTVTYSLYDTTHDFVDAYLHGAVDMIRIPFGADPELLPATHSLATTTVTGLFVARASSSPLTQPGVLAALGHLVDREAIVRDVYGGRAQPHTSMLPAPLAPVYSPDTYDPDTGLALLAEAGWTFDTESATMRSSSDTSSDVSTPFSFTLATVNAPHLLAAAEHIRAQLARFGIDVAVDIYTTEAFHDDIIPNRSFDALLFGLGLETPSSLNVFWHSKHRKAFNITEYTNPATDDLLDKAHTEFDPTLRASLYDEFDGRITQDQPALMLYSQSVGIAVDKRFTTPMPAVVDVRHHQFAHMHKWFRYGTPVWNSF